MHRLVVPIFIVVVTLAFSCAREPAEEAGEAAPDTMAAVMMAPPPGDSVSAWVRQGETKAVTSRNGKACIFVRDRAIVGLGDSVRFTIKRVGPAEDLPADEELPPGLRAAKQAGRTVFPPIYDFRAHNTANQEITQFPDTLIFAICSVARPAQSAEVKRASLVRDPEDPAHPDSLERLKQMPPPDECEFRRSCIRRENASAQTGAVSMGRWLTGSLVVATPALAAQCTGCFDRGIGGGGTSNSPFAAVDFGPQ